MSTTRRDPTSEDLGLHAVERAFEAMQIDQEWSMREDRGFTWWGAWLRQRIWAGEAVRSKGDTLWHVRARTPALRDVEDEPATYAFVNELNSLVSLSAYVYDPDDRTVSARCGAFVYDEVSPWLEAYLVMAVALQSSIAWGQVPPQAGDRLLDDAPHPGSGPRRDPDDMLNLAGTFDAGAAPVSRAVLRQAATTLADEGFQAEFGPDAGSLDVLVPLTADLPAMWSLVAAPHPLLGWGMLARLVVPRRNGLLRADWLANALNLAEAADWAGETRPHALGAWGTREGTLVHQAFFPARLVGELDEEAAMLLVRNLFVWGAVRARFAGDRLPWLDTAAASRYPDDDPPPIDADDVVGDDDEDGEGDGHEDGHERRDDDAESRIPVAERSFGEGSRVPRPRPDEAATAASLERRAPRELLVDQEDPAAFAEIDDAMLVAEDGDTIRVRPGTYRRPVVVDRAVVIEGDGDVEAVVLEPVGGECLGIAASGAVVRGLSIRPARVGNDGRPWSAIAVHDRAATIERCRLTSHLGATVWIGGPSSLAVLRDCALTDGAQNAAWVTEEARAELVGCRVSGNRWPVVANGAHAVVAVEGCEIADNFDDGIAAADGAALRIERTVVRGNAGTGIGFFAAAPASSAVDCEVTGNTGPGIVVRSGHGVRIAGNRITRNDAGIVIDERASPTIEANDVADNTHVGIGVVGGGTDPVVSDNTIVVRHGSGIVVRHGSRGTFERNRLAAGDGPGIWVADEASAPTFRANVVSGGSMAGVAVSEGGGGTFESNDLRGNAGGSWELESPGDLRRVGNLEDAGRGPGDPPAAAGASGLVN